MSAVPTVVTPVTGTDFNFQKEIDTFVESSLPEHSQAMFYELIDVFNSNSDLSKRDDQTEQTIESLLNAVNSSGIIWEVLDAVADSPSRIEYLSNLTTSLLKGRNITIKPADLLSESSDLTKNLNISGILAAVENSGLVTSLLDGLLLDTNFRPHLVDLIDRIVLSQKNVLLYIFAVYLSKRDSEFAETDLFELMKRADNQYAGSLGTFATNAIGSIVSSPLVANIAADVLNALNDTGFAVYFVQRFISTESYINMTGTLLSDIISSVSINIDTTGFNASSLVTGALGDPKAIASFVGSLLSGDTSQLQGYVGKYAGAIGDILQDLEKKGLFAELNSYIFGDSSSSTQASQSTSTASSNNKDVSVANVSTTATASKSSSAAAASIGLLNAESNTPFFKALTIVVGGALLML
ncbi:PGA45 Predicted GPI-anchored protein 45 [Candida maltosa Xu316]